MGLLGCGQIFVDLVGLGEPIWKAFLVLKVDRDVHVACLFSFHRLANFQLKLGYLELENKDVVRDWLQKTNFSPAWYSDVFSLLMCFWCPWRIISSLLSFGAQAFA